MIANSVDTAESHPYSAICLDPPPGGSAEPIMLRDMRPTYGTTLGCPVTN